MSVSYISGALRQLVAARADYRCEHCRLPETRMYYRGQIDHIISEKHGGPTREDNLAFCCLPCNRHKGSDIASLAADGTVTRLFHPRQDRWETRFFVVGLLIQARTPPAEATIRLLQLNAAPRLAERELLPDAAA